MRKISLIALVASVALAAPAVLAQTQSAAVSETQAVDRVCRAAVNSLPASSSVTTFEAQIAGAVEGTGAGQEGFTSGLTSCAAAPGTPPAAVTAIRNLLANVGLTRLRQTGSVSSGFGNGGSSAFSNPPGAGGGGGGGSDYNN